MPNSAGLLNIDKPAGMTSHDVVQRVRRISDIRRIGHAGTLDPLATGVLLLCLGRATRLLEYLVGRSKTYETAVRLGQETDTYDADGRVTAERPFTHITRAQIEAALPQFRGSIQQRPPRYAAIKKDGKPLYKLARQGVDVTPPLRQVNIYRLELLEWQPPLAHLQVKCSTGTYVRSLAHDLGKALECGGHVQRLRRTAVGDFLVQDGIPLAELTTDNWQALLQPSDTAVSHLPALHLSSIEAQQLRHGQRPERRSEIPVTELTRAYDENGRFIGIVTANEKYLQPRKIFYPPQ